MCKYIALCWHCEVLRHTRGCKRKCAAYQKAIDAAAIHHANGSQKTLRRLHRLQKLIRSLEAKPRGHRLYGLRSSIAALQRWIRQTVGGDYHDAV